MSREVRNVKALFLWHLRSLRIFSMTYAVNFYAFLDTLIFLIT